MLKIGELKQKVLMFYSKRRAKQKIEKHCVTAFYYATG